MQEISTQIFTDGYIALLEMTSSGELRNDRILKRYEITAEINYSEQEKHFTLDITNPPPTNKHYLLIATQNRKIALIAFGELLSSGFEIGENAVTICIPWLAGNIELKPKEGMKII